MKRAQAIGLGAWDFVVGDDWQVAIGVVLSLALTALIADVIDSAWWTMPLAVVCLLTASVGRAARASARG